ncbi:hypothetical protein L1887_61831 [Cichorium endivia]|nr:hypothetical protein L1887_61831 [Cichorium endivia]
MHLLFNMVTLGFMSPPVVALTGPTMFLVLYCGGGIISSVVSMVGKRVFETEEQRRRRPFSHGASGSVRCSTPVNAPIRQATSAASWQASCSGASVSKASKCTRHAKHDRPIPTAAHGFSACLCNVFEDCVRTGDGLQLKLPTQSTDPPAWSPHPIRSYTRHKQRRRERLSAMRASIRIRTCSYLLEHDEQDDDDLEILGVAGGHLVLQELQHVLEHLDAGIEQIDALWDLQIAPRGRIERFQIGLPPKDLGAIDDAADEMDVHAQDEQMADLLHDFGGGHADLAALGDALRDVLGAFDRIVDDALEEGDLGRLRQRVRQTQLGHVRRTPTQRDHVVVDARVVGKVPVQILALDVLRSQTLHLESTQLAQEALLFHQGHAPDDDGAVVHDEQLRHHIVDGEPAAFALGSCCCCCLVRTLALALALARTSTAVVLLCILTQLGDAQQIRRLGKRILGTARVMFAGSVGTGRRRHEPTRLVDVLVGVGGVEALVERHDVGVVRGASGVEPLCEFAHAVRCCGRVGGDARELGARSLCEASCIATHRALGDLGQLLVHLDRLFVLALGGIVRGAVVVIHRVVRRVGIGSSKRGGRRRRLRVRRIATVSTGVGTTQAGGERRGSPDDGRRGIERGGAAAGTARRAVLGLLGQDLEFGGLFCGAFAAIHSGRIEAVGHGQTRMVDGGVGRQETTSWPMRPLGEARFAQKSIPPAGTGSKAEAPNAIFSARACVMRLGGGHFVPPGSWFTRSPSRTRHRSVLLSILQNARLLQEWS